MRKGYRIIDIDTHVNPCVEVLLDHADKDMRERMDDLKPYLRVVTPRLGTGGRGGQGGVFHHLHRAGALPARGRGQASHGR